MRYKVKTITTVLALAILVAISTIFIKLNLDRSASLGAGANLPAAAFVDTVEPTPEFMSAYHEGISELATDEHQENILIVTSLTGVPDNFGATKVVAGPNHQYFLRYDSEEAKDAALTAFRASDSIAYVDENVIHYVDSVPYNSWGIAGTKMDFALDYASTRQDLNDVTVAVIDSGCDVPLVKKYYPNKLSGVYNALTGSTDEANMTEEHGHGTHVIGTVAEATPDNVKILAVKVGNSTSGSLSTLAVIAGINYIVEHESADVLNMSFGAPQPTTAEQIAIQSAKDKNIISVAAAGNENTSLPNYPSNYDTTLSIASVTSTLEKSTFSNFGKYIDFAAPGSHIKSLMSNNVAMSSNKWPSDDDDHGTASGTSMATPHASAAVAILKSFNKTISLADTTAILKQHAIDLGESGRDDFFGYGLISFAGSEFCEDAHIESCDEYGIFKTQGLANADGITSIALANSASSPINLKYSYGNAYTDLSNIQVKLSYGDDFSITKPLYALLDDADATITGYDSFATGTQNVTLSYRGKSLTFDVVNEGNAGWETGFDEYGKLHIVGINYDVPNFPGAIQIPDTLAGEDIYGLSGATFNGQSTLTKVSIPSTVAVIDDYTFYNCQNLTSITLPDSLLWIGDGAFAYTGLKTLDLPDSLIYIGEEAFFYTDIDKIHIPANVEYIQPLAFARTSQNLASITVDSNNPNFYSDANSSYIAETDSHTLIKGYYKTTLGPEITAIGAGAFADEEQMPSSIHIPSTITSIGEKAYFNISSDSSEDRSLQVIIPDTVETLGDNAFKPGDPRLMILTYYDSAAANFADTNQISYQAVDYKNIKAQLTDSNNIAFGQANGHLLVYAQYSGGKAVLNNGILRYTRENGNAGLYNDNVTNIASKGISIAYQDPTRNSFLASDTYITVSGTDGVFQNPYTAKCTVTVAKATPSYTVPTALTGTEGQTLSQIALPTGFTWMAPDTVLVAGEHTYKATFTPTDTDNYQTIDDIDITVTASGRPVITPVITVADKTYDGTTAIDLDTITVSGLAADEYTITGAVSTTANASETNTKANITIKLSDAKYATHTLVGGQQEYTYSVDFTINKATPTYETPTSLTAIEGQKLSQVALPTGFAWMSPSTTLVVGTNTYPATYTPTDTQNYLTIENINLTVEVRAKTVITPTITVADKTYDGTTHIAFDAITVTGLEPSEYTITSASSTTANAAQAGTKANIILKLSDAKFATHAFAEGKQEQTFTVDFTINKAQPEITDSTKNLFVIYDSTAHTISLDLTYDGEATVKYQDETSAFTLDTAPSYTEAGTYIIAYKVHLDDNHEDYIGKRAIIINQPETAEPGEETPQPTITGKDSFVILSTEYTFDTLESKLKATSPTHTFAHLNQKHAPADTDTICTGDIIQVTVGEDTFEFELAYRGDVNGDGDISIIDYIRIMKYIMQVEDFDLTGVYHEAADVNGDNAITIIDYIRIMKVLI